MTVTTNEGQAPSDCVLLLEDDPSNRELLKFQLELLGYDTDAVASGEEGYEQWRAKRHRIVLTDCNLPGMSGFELAAAIRKTERGIGTPTTVVGITGYRLEDVADEYRNSGMDRCLAKPILLSDLTDILPKRASAEADDIGLSSDQVALDDMVMDNRDHCKRLFSILVKSLRESASALDDICLSRSISSFGSIAHRIRSSALAVGADSLAAICRRAEGAAKEQNWQKLEEIHPSLVDAINIIVQRAKDIFPEGWKATNDDPICPLAFGTYQPFRKHCGQCEFRILPPK